MKSKLLATVTAAALSLTGLPAFAWEYGEESGLFYYGFQMSEDGQFGLVVDCDEEFGTYSLSIESGEPWEETTSYASEVPITFVIDGQSFATDSFRFINRGGLVAVALNDYSDSDMFDALYKAIYEARSEIAVSYFDKSLRFGVDEVAGTLEAIDLACW